MDKTVYDDGTDPQEKSAFHAADEMARQMVIRRELEKKKAEQEAAKNEESSS